MKDSKHFKNLELKIDYVSKDKDVKEIDIDSKHLLNKVNLRDEASFFQT
jgi:hypothetical protein